MVGKCQRSNQVGKWLNFYHYHLLLQIKIHRPGFQAWMAHEVFLVIEVLMSGKKKCWTNSTRANQNMLLFCIEQYIPDCHWPFISSSVEFTATPLPPPAIIGILALVT